MPTRILRDGILSSRSVNSISEQAEILYRRLMSVVDDYGRTEADADLLRAKCFPLQLERWPSERVQAVLEELGKSPLVTVYHRCEKSYLQIENFGQRLQSKERFPAPTPHESTTRAGSNSRSVADFKELRRTTVNHGEPPLKSESESESYSESQSQSVSGAVVAMPEIPKGLPLPTPVIQHEYPLTLAEIQKHDSAVDPFFCIKLADEVARALVSDPVACRWPPGKADKAVSDPIIARACRESFLTPGRNGKHGAGLLLRTVPRIVINGKTNYA